eukprot:scaffold42800_cov52-Attheya_sp.AAC.2
MPYVRSLNVPDSDALPPSCAAVAMRESSATTRSDHVQNNEWERISVAVGDIGGGWLVAVVESLGVVVGVEGAMVSI